MSKHRFSWSQLATSILVMLTLMIAMPAMAFDLSTLNQEIEKCQKKHAYDPAQQSHLGPNELADNERAFLDCVYTGTEKTVIPKAMVPDEYKQLVSRHRQMTNALEQGEMTRQQRSEETQKMLADIKNKKVAESERRIRELSAKRDQFLKQRERMLRRNPRMF